jgi:dephospho-CoA kinase
MVHPLIDQEVKKIINQEQKSRNIVINGAVLHKSSLINDFDVIIFSQSFFLIRLFRAFLRDGFHPFRILKRFWNQKDLVPQLFFPHVDIYKIRNNFSGHKLEKDLSELLHIWNEEGDFNE